MSREPLVVVHRDADVLAAAVAARLITRLTDAQVAHGEASVVLTGGGIGAATLAAVAASPARDALDWSRLDVWWGDERFLSTGHPERNETQAREALLDLVPLDAARVHAMPAVDGPDGDDPEAAARRYAAALAERALAGGQAERPQATRPRATRAQATRVQAKQPKATRPQATQAQAMPPRATRPQPTGLGGFLPRLDVLLLGVGDDGHVASLFPGRAHSGEERSVVAVRDAPKPPPTRLSLSMPALRSAEEVWLIVAGAAKAAVVARALRGADEVDVPAAGPRATSLTRWLLDEAAAGDIPGGSGRGAR